MLRIITLNLNGIRSACTKGLLDWLPAQQADFLCVQELKAQDPDLRPEMRAPAGMRGWFHAAEKKGYSGVGIYSRHTPDRVVEGLGIPAIDAEGRFLQLDFGKLSVVSLYLPSGSSSEERQQVKFDFMDRFLPHMDQLFQSGQEVVVCGDWNIAHREADLKNWKSNQKNSGFLPEERAWMTKLLGAEPDGGLVDVYRRLQPETTDACYTWWSNRGQAYANNVGWRLDYHLATPQLAELARSEAIYKGEKFSDHAPITVGYDLVL